MISELARIWLPFLVLVGIFVFFLSRTRARTDSVVELQKLHLDEISKQTALLARLVEAAEKRGG